MMRRVNKISHSSSRKLIKSNSPRSALVRWRRGRRDDRLNFEEPVGSLKQCLWSPLARVKKKAVDPVRGTEVVHL